LLAQDSVSAGNNFEKLWWKIDLSFRSMIDGIDTRFQHIPSSLLVRGHSDSEVSVRRPHSSCAGAFYRSGSGFAIARGRP